MRWNDDYASDVPTRSKVNRWGVFFFRFVGMGIAHLVEIRSRNLSFGLQEKNARSWV